MQRLVKSTATGEFLSPDWRWTNDLAYARRFRDVSEVIGVLRVLEGIQVEMVIMLSDAPSPYDISLPLTMPHTRALGPFDDGFKQALGRR